MTVIKTIFILAGMFVLVSCNDSKDKKDTTVDTTTTEKTTTAGDGEVHGTEFKPGDVQLTSPLNQEWVGTGKNIYEVKCQSCHKLTAERLVGPGWKDVTKRREPHWIMNMITNVEMMLETDPEAQKLLEQCMVRMPNQNVPTDDARKILEFMRQNDGEK